MSDSSLFIPVILGTPRQGRQSEHVAKFILEQVAARDRLETELIDIRKFSLLQLKETELFRHNLKLFLHLLNIRRYSPTSLKVLDRRQRC